MVAGALAIGLGLGNGLIAEGGEAPEALPAAALSTSCSGNPGDPFVVCQTEESVVSIVDGDIHTEHLAAASSVMNGGPTAPDGPIVADFLLLEERPA
ncbi:MAG: hypothetical protein HYS09_03525 [Chloroflexi bacterium]|nr:hypothetical protein [Chloroflexota bacterium]